MHYTAILDAICASCGGTDPQPFEDAVAVLAELHELTEGPDNGPERVAEHAYNRYLRELAKERVVEAARSDLEAAGRLLRAVEDMLRIDAPTDFDAFMQYMEWGREPEKRFYQPRRSVLLQVAFDLQDLEDGRIDFLSISTPPRVGKSTIGCFYMAFCMGRHPDNASVMSGFSDKLTSSFYLEVLSLVSDGDTYRFQEIFPNAPVVATNAADEQIHLQSKRRFPTMTARSASGTLTGAVEVGRKGCLYCDDMVEDYEEALNPDRMDKLYEAYVNQLRDRKLPGSKEVHIGTRWVPNDIIGRIEDLHGDNPRYRLRRIPALDVSKASPEHPLGESNFVYQFGLGFPTEYYEDMYETLMAAGSEDSWWAKYMTAPYWKEGRLFEREELQWYEQLPDGEPDAIIAVCDTKTKGKDYCVQPIGYVYQGRHYIHDVVCDDALMEHIQPRLVEHLLEHSVDLARYESNVAGGVIARQVEEACRAAGSHIEIATKYSTENKETRILADAGWVKANCLFRSDKARGKDYDVFINQLCAYSAKGKNAHDDAPDAMSMYRRFAQVGVMAEAQAFERPW